MTESPNESNSPSNAAASGKPRRRRFWMLTGVVAMAGVLAACAQHGSGGPDGGHGWRHGHGGMQGAMDPQTMGRRIDKGVEWVLSDVNATPEQKQKVSAIAKAAATELAPLREQHRAARKQVMQLLSAPTVDRAALEAVRAEQLKSAEAASRRVTQALADIADVLTPEQRVKLRERAESRMARRGWGG